MLTLRGAEIREYRYWDPFADPGRVEWLKEEDLEEFEPCFARAVKRCVPGTPGIFLSGGLDSIAVAIAAADHSRAMGAKTPLALSLVFPDADSNEEPIQSGVASRLGIEQLLVPFEESLRGSGLLRAALLLSAASPEPIWNMWAPAYVPMAEAAREHGCRVVLTGRGGDEWLTVSPYLLADKLRTGDIAGAARLIRTRQRSNGLSGMRATGRLVWRTAGRPLASAALDAVAPIELPHAREIALLSERPSWVAPDPVVQPEL